MGEIRLAIRSLLKSKLFATVAVLTLAIGIGATTAVFAVFDAVALRPLPFTAQHRLVDIEEWSAMELCDGCAVGMSLPMLEDVEARATTLQALIAYTESAVNVGGGDAPERVSSASVTGNFFGVLGLNATLGRTLDPTDDRPGAPRVAVVSERFFQHRFGGDPGAIGRTIRINGAPAVLVGVLPPTAVLPDFAQIWLPLDRRAMGADRSTRDLGVIGRLKDGVTRAEAEAELRKIAADLEQAYPATQRNWTARVRPLRVAVGDDDRGPFGMMLGAVLVLWAVVCANLAALLLARGLSRRREVAVRLALGGDRRAVVWHLFAESLCIAIAGGALGALAAAWLVQGVLAGLGTTIPSWLTPRLDGSVLGFCLALSLVSAAAFGLIPAFRASRAAIQEDLKSGTPANLDGGKNVLRGSLVVMQLSLSLMLLAVAGVLSTTIAARSARTDPNDADVVQARVEMLGEASPDRMIATVNALTERLAALPEARAAAASADGFIAGFGGSDERIHAEGVPDLPDGVSPRFYHAVSPGFLEVARLKMAEGRWFTSADTRGAAPVAVINRNLAGRLWPGRPAVGHRIRLGADSLPWLTIVGVVADAGDTTRRIDNVAYVPFAQSPMPAITLRVAARGEPASLIRPMRDAARAASPDLPLIDHMTAAQAHAQRWRPMRAYALTISAIGAVALLLAAIGLYGIVAYAAGQRTREIGVRIALGATGRDVVRLVTRQGMTLVGLGLVFGLIGAAMVAPLMRGLLFGASPVNVFVYGAAAATLLIIAAIASYLPARRAARVDPMVALRNE